MSDELVRFGVAMEQSLLTELDALVAARESTRSEVLRDLVRAAVAKRELARGVDAVATLTLIYDHHVRDLTERLTQLQHDLGERIRSTLHVHLDHDHCLEVVILHGKADELHEQAARILAIKGVLHGGIEIYARAAHEHDSHSHSHSQEAPSQPNPRGKRGERARPAVATKKPRQRAVVASRSKSKRA